MSMYAPLWSTNCVNPPPPPPQGRTVEDARGTLIRHASHACVTFWISNRSRNWPEWDEKISDFHHTPLDISRERLYVGNLFYILFHAFDLKWNISLIVIDDLFEKIQSRRREKRIYIIKSKRQHLVVSRIANNKAKWTNKRNWKERDKRRCKFLA